MSCTGCKYYDDSVDCCNGDDLCYMDGYFKGKEDAMGDFAEWMIDQFALLFDKKEIFARYKIHTQVKEGKNAGNR